MSVAFRIDLTGQVFGRLTAISVFGKNKYGKTLWHCSCECGSVTLVSTGDLRSGNTKSCGCGQKSALIARVEQRKAEAVGSLHPRAQSAWRHMLERCEKPDSDDYQWYGARGISVCERWHDLRAFIDDMGDPPPGMTLDRIDVDGNYEPGNCRWATYKQQARNRRNNVRVQHGGVSVTIAELSEASGVPASTIYSRVSRGAPPL